MWIYYPYLCIINSMSLDAIQIFVEVVNAQSFSQAAKRLGIPATTVSANIARLEKRLGVTLIQRTTRRIHVTDAGRSYFEHCARALKEILEGERELTNIKSEPMGLLRITAAADLVQSLITPLIEQFISLYPKTSVELIVANKTIDLIAKGVDLGIRIGPFEDSSLVIRKFCSARVALWASAEYLNRRGTPQTPDELHQHDSVRFSRFRDDAFLKSEAGDLLDMSLPSRIVSDDLESVKTFVQRGNGIGLLPEFVANHTYNSEAKLVRVLPDYMSDESSIYFAYPSQQFVPQTVRAFINLATNQSDAFS